VEDATKDSVVEEEKEEITSRDFDLPEMENFHDSVEEKPPLEAAQQANIVLAFWHFFMTVFFFSFLEGNDKKITNEPSNKTKTTTSSDKKDA